MKDVSFLIPARQEIYLEQTVRNILSNICGNSEVLVYLDGYIPDPQLHFNDNRVIFHHPTEKAVGHRAATNYLARQAKGKYICKLDAHCAIDEGFDVKMMEDCEYDWTVIPRMYNLDVETFKPKLIENFEHAVRMGKVHDYISMGINDKGELSTLYYPHDLNKKLHHERKDILIDEILSCMGCCFFMHKDRFWELEGCDEAHGIWGAQAVEVSLKAWLSGGKLMVNKKTWFSHWFRGGGGPGWPYPISAKQVNHARKYSKDLWLNNKWNKQIKPLAWLISKFWPVPSWTDNDLRSLELTSGKFMDSSIFFPHIHSVTDLTSSTSATRFSDGEQVPSDTMSPSGLLGTITVSSEDINSMSSESKMSGVTTKPNGTDMVDNRNILPEISSQRTDEPGIHNSVNSDFRAIKSDSSISKIVSVSSPQPTSSISIDRNFSEKTDNSFGVKFVDNKSIHSPHYIQKHIDKSSPQILPRRNKPNRGTHLPVLMALINKTEGTVLELGSGMYSTPYLHWACHNKRKLITYEDNPDWIDFARQFETELHEVVFVKDWNEVKFPDASVALVDHDPKTKRTRSEDVARLTHVDFVVCHDSDNKVDHKYRYSTVFGKFKYRYKYKDAGSPYTTVFSNKQDPQERMNEAFDSHKRLQLA